MDTSLCVGSYCRLESRGQHSRAAAPAMCLCGGCYKRLRADLFYLPEVYEECGSALLPRREGVMSRRVKRGQYAAGIRLNEAAVNARTAIVDSLSSWAALVAEERAVGKPRHRNPKSLASFLITHLDWLATHPATADFTEEISDLTSLSRQSTYGQTSPQIEIGFCIHDGCDGTISIMPPAPENGRPRQIRCSSGHVWPPHEWLKLSLQIQRALRTDSAIE